MAFTVELRFLRYLSTVPESIKFLRASPRTALLWIGGVGFLAGGFLMLVLVWLLQ
jgi:hypothetical protein